MKSMTPTLFILLFALACSSADDQPSSESWTENQEAHFYSDCKKKMLENSESEGNAHAFCECCLLRLKETYSDGKEAMQNLTDEEIARIEKECGRNEMED